MQSNTDFTKGLNTDFDAIAQPVGTYRNMLNAIRDMDGSVSNEKGTSELVPLKPEMTIVGHTVLGDEVILLMTDSVNSEIGVLSSNDTYTTKLSSQELDFDYTKKLDVQSRIDFQGHRIIYFTGTALRRLDLDDVPSVNIAENLKLGLTYATPQVDVVDVDDTGELPTGVYQFAVRLVTASMNKTMFSTVTNVCPIVDEATSSTRDLYDGALPQSASPKAIKLSITNIDTNFAYIEVVAITYVGLANQFTANVVGLVPIQNRTSLDFRYYSVAQNKEDIAREELVQIVADYDKAEHLEQKDGHLFAANLSTSSAVIDDLTLQGIANAVRMKYTTTEVNYSEDVRPQHESSGGTDIGVSSVLMEDYKKEINVFKRKGYMRDEVYSFGLVLRFRNKTLSKAYHIPGRLVPSGTDLRAFTTEIPYPMGYGYPTGNVRHHRMPTMKNVPTVNNAQSKITILGVQASNIDLSGLTDYQRSQIESIIIVRQLRRDVDKTILAQGIANKLYYKNNVNGLLVLPYNGMGAPWNSSNGDFFSENTRVDNRFAFYSPETIFNKVSLTRAKYIHPVLQMRGTNYGIADKRTDGRGEKYSHVFTNLNQYFPFSAATPFNLEPGATEYIPEHVGNNDLYTGRADKPYILKEGNGYVSMKMSGNTGTPTWGTYGDPIDNDIQFYDRSGVTDTIEFRQTNGQWKNQDAASQKGFAGRYLYNITTDNATAYGELNDAIYHAIAELVIPKGSPTTVWSIDAWGGDTFITKWAVVLTTGEFLNSSLDYGLRFRSLQYFFVESTVNTNHRHFGLSTGDIQGTLPYYPKTKALWVASGAGLLQADPALGHSTGYNKQYSFENNVVPHFPKLLGEVTVTNFPNRVMYSSQSIEGEQLDAYRIFLANNYHDIPKNKGAISDLFVFNNDLYIHTPGSLFKAFVNQATTQATSSGDVYLGNGGLFPRPSVEVTTVSGGYAGSSDKWATCVTPFGVFFVDKVQDKVFKLGEGLVDISDQGLFKFFLTSLKPSNGLTSVFDYKEKRWILSGSQFTLSYGAELNSWSSFHDYKFNYALSKGNRILCTEDANPILYELGTGNYGNYFGTTYPMKMRIVNNNVPPASKRFDNLVLLTSSTKPEGTTAHHDTFSTVQVFNRTTNTGLCNVVVPKSFEDEMMDLALNEVFAKLKSHEFRVAIPSDLVIDPSLDIFAEENLDTDRVFKPRITGKYAEVELVYNNTDNNAFTVHTVVHEFRQLDR